MRPRASTTAGTAATASRRVAIYTRKSVAIGAEETFSSLDAQREACEHYARAQAHLGWQLVPDRFDDGGFTGANLDRPAFQRLMADVDAGKIDVIIVYKIDRVSRSLLDFATVMGRLSTAGVDLVSITQNFSTADAMGRLTLNMLMSFAEFEREMIAERTRDKMCAARRRGKWTGGPVPLGYDVVEKKLVVNKLEAVLVREIFALYLETRSVLAVARELNARGRTTKRCRSEAGRVRGGKRWSKADVRRLLKSPVYAGLMGCSGEVHAGEQPGIVERATYDQVQDLLVPSGHASRKDHGRNPSYILRGILFCAPCGKAFTPASTRRGEKEFRYYRCTTRDREGKEACPSRPLSAKAIEEHVIARVREVTAGGGLASEVTEAVKARLAAKRADLLTARKELPGWIAALSAEGKRLLVGREELEGRPRALAEERLREVGDELKRAEAQLAEVEGELASLKAVEVEAGWVAQCLADFDRVWDALVPENRGRMVRAIVERVEVDEIGNRVSVELADLGLDLQEGAAA